MSLDPRVVDAIRFQRLAVEHASLASPLYAALLDAMLHDVDGAGPASVVLAAAPEGLDPIPDALVLRFLGAVHRLVLAGEAPGLARWYPSAGGTFNPATDGEAASAAFLDAVVEHRDRLVAGLDQGVQTNEVGRCATLAVGFTEVVRRFGLPLRLLELGASAGLNLRWDRWRYESGATSWGDAAAPLRFASNYRAPVPDVTAPLGPDDAVVFRRGCDRSPIDPTTAEGKLLLRSFVWPDQEARLARLDTALAVAAVVPAPVDAADAGSWLSGQLAEAAPGVVTVVFHSIVWQYLPPTTRTAIADALAGAGAAASPESPLAWLRMEPGADLSAAAEVRLQLWPDGDDHLLAYTGYHGHPVWAAE